MRSYDFIFLLGSVCQFMYVSGNTGNREPHVCVCFSFPLEPISCLDDGPLIYIFEEGTGLVGWHCHKVSFQFDLQEEEGEEGRAGNCQLRKIILLRNGGLGTLKCQRDLYTYLLDQVVNCMCRHVFHSHKNLQMRKIKQILVSLKYKSGFL
jgi:hypothetical protein